MQASKNYELYRIRKINLPCHTLIFFMFIGSFNETLHADIEVYFYVILFHFDNFWVSGSDVH